MAQNALELYKRIKSDTQLNALEADPRLAAWTKAAQQPAIVSEYQATQQPIQERGFIAPLGVYEDGSVHAAWPEILAGPVNAFSRQIDRSNTNITSEDDAGNFYDESGNVVGNRYTQDLNMAQDAFNIAGSATTGGLSAASLGMMDNALGSAGGKLRTTSVSTAPKIQSGDFRISTRFPTAKEAVEDPLTHHLSIGLNEYLNSPAFEHNTKLLKKYPGYKNLSKMDPEEAANAYIKQSADNLVWLYQNSPEVMQERSPLWYDGANRIANALAERYGVPRQSVSAAIAALSPQMDWYKNASLAERVGDIMFGPAANKRMSPEMVDYANSQKSLLEPENAEIVKSILGKKLSKIDDPLEQAMWIRLYDEAHNPRAYRSITPEGDYGEFVLKKDGDPKKVAWSSFDNIAKAVKAYLSDGDINEISPLLGNMHKVRNFYNNIEVPNDPRFGDVTADTHQVAAAQLRPLSGTTPAVSHNLATGLDKDVQPPGYVAARSSSLDGVMGTYALNAEATRRAAEELGMLPRQAQSSTWEPVRELFTDVFKRSKNASKVDDVWKAYDRGEISINKARKQIKDIAGGIGIPSWAERDLKVLDPKRASTYR